MRKGQQEGVSGHIRSLVAAITMQMKRLCLYRLRTSVLLHLSCFVLLTSACSRDGHEVRSTELGHDLVDAGSHELERILQSYLVNGIGRVTLGDWKLLSEHVGEMEARQGDQVVPMALEALHSKSDSIRSEAASILARAPYSAPVLRPQRWRAVVSGCAGRH